MESIAYLDMAFCLPLIRKAYDNEKLQMFDTTAMSCDYTGPCAIGVCLTKDLQEALDSTFRYPEADMDSSIGVYFSLGLVTAPVEQQRDFIKLQEMHDNVCIGNAGLHQFGDLLTKMEEKYKKS